MKITKKTRRRTPVFAPVFVLALMVGLVLAGCSLDPGPPPDPGPGPSPGPVANPFLGTWTGYDEEGNVGRLVFSDLIVTMTGTGRETIDGPEGIGGTTTIYTFTYTYTYIYNGNMATIFDGGIPVGTATVSGNTLTVVSNVDGSILILYR